MASSLSHGFGWIFVLFLFWSAFKRTNYVEASHQNFLNPESLDRNPLSSELYRTTYHFQPRKNWINDPNGPMYYKGIYHLFYQYNPYAAVWGNISWGHSVSTDLIYWTSLELALSPTGPFDINGCWTGSATILPGNKPVIIYTGADTMSRQVQNIAFAKDTSDRFLREWIKPDYNPIIEPINGLNPSQFRDPTTGWLGHGGLWRIAVGAEIGKKGRAMLYRSKDFVHWVRANHPLHSTNGTGMWECADFYSLGEKQGSGKRKYVLKMSLGETQSDHYLLGNYDEKNDVFVRDNPSDDYRMWRRYDYGNLYASKTFFDEAKQRRILWGWSNESDSKSDDVAKGWSGIQIFPRVLSLDTHGTQLVQWPIKEIESLRKKGRHLHGKKLKTGKLVEIKGLKASQADVEVEFELPRLLRAEPFDSSWVLDPSKLCREKGADNGGAVGPFGLLVLASHNLEEYTAIFFRIFKAAGSYAVLMCADQRRSSLRAEVFKPTYGVFLDIDIKKDGKISLRTLIDHSVVESFGAGGRACITSRVYPTSLFTGTTHLYAFNNGTEDVKISELNAWNMIKPRIS